MAEEPLKFEYRIPRVMVWLYGLGSLLNVGAAIWTAMSEPGYVSEWERFSRIGQALFFSVGALLFAYWAFHTFRLLRQGPFWLELTDDCVKIPFHFVRKPIGETTVQFEQVMRIRHGQVGCSQHLTIWCGKQRFEIPLGLLASSEAFDELRAALTSRLEAYGVAMEERAFRFSRPRFSLRVLFLITTVLARFIYGFKQHSPRFGCGRWRGGFRRSLRRPCARGMGLGEETVRDAIRLSDWARIIHGWHVPEQSDGRGDWPFTPIALL